MKKHFDFLQLLALVLVVMTFAFDMMFFFVQYPERNHDIVNMIAGVINTVGFASVINFFYGSSKGSKDANDKLRELNDKQGT